MLSYNLNINPKAYSRNSGLESEFLSSLLFPQFFSTNAAILYSGHHNYYRMEVSHFHSYNHEGVSVRESEKEERSEICTVVLIEAIV